MNDSIERQIASSIDIVTDGEMSKAGFFVYVNERLKGFEPRPEAKHNIFLKELAAFPEYYADYMQKAMMGGTVAPMTPMYCVGPVSYKGEAELERDFHLLKEATTGVDCADVFVPAIAPSGVGYNEYYKSDEEYFEAVGEAMRVEYKAIVEADFVLQVDDPFLPDIFVDPALDARQIGQKAKLYVDSINSALRDLLEDRIRFHTCYGINEGPRIYEAALSDVIDHMLNINATVYSFEAANPRHEHEYRIWRDAKLPKGKAIMPGVITHASNIVEHPELIAEWLERFAGLVGRENVVAGADCGFASQASYKTEVHETVIWEKFKAMSEGAKIASVQLWSS